MQNVAIALTGVATVAALSVGAGWALGAGGGIVAALVAGESLKRSKPFARLTEILKHKIDAAAEAEFDELTRKLARHRIFVHAIEPKLRELARSSQNFSWLNATLDWLQRNHGAPSSDDEHG